MPEQTVEAAETTAEDVVFATLPETGFETMTEGGVEFVLCASALTAQM
ncbi:hypothetical protein [Dactylosporangium sp. CS-033363]